MIERTHSDDTTHSHALYSDCENYRYELTRIWDDAGRKLLYVMLNPSTATETRNDPTIERCQRRAQALGYGGLRVVNLFALRETSPARLKQHAQPTGPGNDAALVAGAVWADAILCGWGIHGSHLGRGEQVAANLRASEVPMLHLGLTKGGEPRHPLYIGYAQKPQHWD